LLFLRVLQRFFVSLVKPERYPFSGSVLLFAAANFSFSWHWFSPLRER